METLRHLGRFCWSIVKRLFFVVLTIAGVLSGALIVLWALFKLCEAVSKLWKETA